MPVAAGGGPQSAGLATMPRSSAGMGKDRRDAGGKEILGCCCGNLQHRRSKCRLPPRVLLRRALMRRPPANTGPRVPFPAFPTHLSGHCKAPEAQSGPVHPSPPPQARNPALDTMQKLLLSLAMLLALTGALQGSPVA